MKKSLLLLLMLIFCCAAFLPGMALAEQKTYATTEELLNVWWEEGFPDWVADVYGTEEDGRDVVVICLVKGCEEKEAELRAMLADDSSIRVVTGIEYSYNELMRIGEEVTDKYLGQDPDVYGCGIGWASVDGEIIGFGESGRESRVVVDVSASAYDRLSEELRREYGDLVFVEVSELPIPEEEELGMIGGADEPTSILISSDGSPSWILMVGAVIAVFSILWVAAIIIVLVNWIRAEKKKKAEQNEPPAPKEE